MEFSYRISEADYLNAWKLLSNRPDSRAAIRIVLWAFVLICLVLLWIVVQRNSTIPLVNVGPIIVISGVWAFILTRRGSTTVRREYRKNPTMQGQFSVGITPESISGQNTAGTSWNNGWNIYASWREGKDLILLLYHNGSYLILNVAGLSDSQRAELRGILSTALPKK